MAKPINVVDWHCHHVPARFELTALLTVPTNQRARWETIGHKLRDEKLLVKHMHNGDLAARVINIPANLIADPNGLVPHETIMAINDHVAGLVARHPGHLYGLASVDAYDGDRSAREVERAITELRLRGLFVDCARGDLFLDAPQARPTLKVASKLRVPVFVHPIAAQPLTRQDVALRRHWYAFRAWHGELSLAYRAGREWDLLAIAQSPHCGNGARDRWLGYGVWAIEPTRPLEQST